MQPERITSCESDSSGLLKQLGNIDIYLFDQILKGRFTRNMTILDAGCGFGRNLIYFMNNGYRVFGVDCSSDSIEQLQRLASIAGVESPINHFRQEKIESMSFKDSFFDGVICNAVLHFAKDKVHFDAMLNEIWRVLKLNGILFIRLASSIGIEDLVEQLDGGLFRLPDGSNRFLIDEKMLVDHTRKLHATLLEPLKTVNVQNQRCMTTWVMSKS